MYGLWRAVKERFSGNLSGAAIITVPKPVEHPLEECFVEIGASSELVGYWQFVIEEHIGGRLATKWTSSGYYPTREVAVYEGKKWFEENITDVCCCAAFSFSAIQHPPTDPVDIPKVNFKNLNFPLKFRVFTPHRIDKRVVNR